MNFKQQPTCKQNRMKITSVTPLKNASNISPPPPLLWSSLGFGSLIAKIFKPFQNREMADNDKYLKAHDNLCVLHIRWIVAGTLHTQYCLRSSPRSEPIQLWIRLISSTRIFFIKGQVQNFSTHVPYVSLDIQYSCPIRCPLFLPHKCSRRLTFTPKLGNTYKKGGRVAEVEW